MTEADADDAELVPAALVAVTVKVYPVADCSPDTVIGLKAPVPVNPPGLDVTVYEVIGSLLVAGALNDTVAAPLLYPRLVPTFEADTLVGTVGAALAPLDTGPISLAIFSLPDFLCNAQ